MNTKIRVRAYVVGFGDCVLLTLADGTKRRNILFDFGRAPSDSGSLGRFPEIAQDIRDQCKNELDLLVVTHEHLDHMEGFYREREIFSHMKIHQVLLGLPSMPGYYEQFPKAKLQRRLQDALRSFASQSRANGVAFDPAFSSLMANNLSNSDRMEYLRSLGATTRYLARGDGVLELPGWGKSIRITVLAPERDASSYYGRSAKAISRQAAVARFASKQGISSDEGLEWTFGRVERWNEGSLPGFSHSDLARLRRQINEGAVTAARFIDRAANNTSLALLVEAHGKRMLFPGDAELESWEKMEEHFGSTLGPIDFLKASHHGSHNGTPSGFIEKLLPKERAAKAQVLVSTKCNVYGTKNPVPDAHLMEDFARRGRVTSTDGASELYRDVFM